MGLAIALLDAVIGGLRAGAAVVLLLAAGLATAAWAVRTRRVNAFGGLARFVRRWVDPMLRPLERRLAMTGATGASIPWWGLLFLLLALAAGIFILSFLRDGIVGAYFAMNSGPRGIVALGVRWVFGVLQLALLVRVLTGWIGGAYSAIGRLAFRMTEWFLAPLRRVIPPLGMLDLTPIVAWFLLGLVQGALLTFL